MTRPLLSYLSPLLACAVACAVACAACGGMVLAGCSDSRPAEGIVEQRRMMNGQPHLLLYTGYGVRAWVHVTPDEYSHAAGKACYYYKPFSCDKCSTLPAESNPTPSGKGGAE